MVPLENNNNNNNNNNNHNHNNHNHNSQKYDDDEDDDDAAAAAADDDDVRVWLYRMKLPAVTVILLASIVVVSDSFIMLEDDPYLPKAINVKNRVPQNSIRQYGGSMNKVSTSTMTVTLCTKTRSSCLRLNLPNPYSNISLTSWSPTNQSIALLL